MIVWLFIISVILVNMWDIVKDIICVIGLIINRIFK